jgi:DnaJ-class molecular chaperone
MKKIPNQGMSNMETHHTGDLIIQFDVEFPPMNFFNDPNILQVRKIRSHIQKTIPERH